MIFLSFVPLITVLVGMCIVEIKCAKFECIDLAQDILECDMCWCYDDGGCGFSCCTCSCCTMPNNR